MSIIIMEIYGLVLSILIHTGHHLTGGIIHPGTDGRGDSVGTIPTHGGICGLMNMDGTGFIPITAGFTGILIILIIMIHIGFIMMGIMEMMPIGFGVEHHWEIERHMV